MAKKVHPGLIGLHFLRFDSDGISKGEVLAYAGADHYLLETLPWTEGGVSLFVVLSVGTLAAREGGDGFMFFRSAAERDGWYEELGEEAEAETGAEPEPGRVLQ